MLANRNSMGKDPERPWADALGLMASISADLLGYTGIGVGLGYLLWKKASMPWWVLLIFSLGGMSFGMYRLYRRSQKLM